MKPIVVCLKGDTTNQVIQVADEKAKLDNIRQLAAEALHILVDDTREILLYNSSGRLLGGVDDIWQEQVIYVDLPCHVKDAIPGPTKLPIVGNLYDLMPNFDAGLLKLFDTYGPVIDISWCGNRAVCTNDPLVAKQFLKENEYFTKKIAPTSLSEVQKFAGDGLFTSDTDAGHWKLAHKLLMPAFSPRAIKAYQEEMGSIVLQTISILDQFQPNESYDVLAWMTKVTFETIGRIGFGYDFGLLDAKDAPPHPMIDAMNTLLELTVTRSQQMEIMKYLPTASNLKFDSCIKLMHKIVSDVIQERKNGPDAANKDKDLLGFMLNARDESDEGLTDENIRDQVVTFLIAGHDTTANTLAWLFYELARHPDVQAKVLQEIANVGITHDTLPTVEQVNSLKYTMQVIKETLRMYPPVRDLPKFARKECVIPYGYKVPGETPLIVYVYGIHHNEAVYPNSYHFDPDRFTSEEEEKRSSSAWLPFSTGPRACIGRPFAIQEAKTVIAMLLHKYEFKYDGPTIDFDPQSATTKPTHLSMTIHPRTNFPEPNPNASLPSSPKPAQMPSIPRIVPTKVDSNSAQKLPKVTFLYATQTGTSQDYANQLFQQAKGFGFSNASLLSIDKWQGYETKYNAPENKELVVLCLATYNGQPPDPAEKFNKFLDKMLGDAGHEKHFDGLLFAVFGVGNKNWRTYQHFPIKVDNALDQMGATRVFGRGEGNADQDMDSDFNNWSAHFWISTLEAYGLAASVEKSVVPVEATSKISSASIKIRYLNPKSADFKRGTSNKNLTNYRMASIQVNRELQQNGSGRSTRHIELDVSELNPVTDNKDGLPYITGDHMEIYPENSCSLVESIGLNFGWILDSVFEVDEEAKQGVSSRSLAAVIDGPCTIRNALTYYADLTGSPSRLFLHCYAHQLRKATSDAVADAFEEQFIPHADGTDPYPDFIKTHRTMLDVQLAFPQVKGFDLGQFLAAAGAMQPRRYSIASSPLVNSKTAALTVGVVDDLLNGKCYPGLSSSYLAHCLTGDAGKVAIRASFKSAKSSFALPKDPEVPIIMISAGTGVSPFRGFLEERAVLKQQGKKVGANVLFFGCRRSDQDFIYKEEWARYQDLGVLTDLHVAFSRLDPPSPNKYVQHQVLLQASQVWSLMNPDEASTKPASIYICGAGEMSRDVRSVFLNMIKSFDSADSEETAVQVLQQWADQGRYNEDVWG
ncbi:cytochrome P450 [Hesseltinella vesiculosa]|uniref:NADPH--hemoprotein reductase n=1 Tax=Hesseltinella vesiculosa TaxID=101127 RepID=A0A1X2GGR2_9FUNG|nr:cytochrome P450 [Hesseltinella vesiculosa]